MENFRIEQINFVRAIQKCWVIRSQQYYNLYRVIFDVTTLVFAYKRFFEKKIVFLSKCGCIQDLSVVIVVKLKQLSTMLKSSEYRISGLRRVQAFEKCMFKRRPLIIMDSWDKIVVFVMHMILLYGAS